MAVIGSRNRVGLFPMCADILHAGHMLALKEAKENCDYLVVALNTHPDGKHPVQSVFERYFQLGCVQYVDKVIPYQGRADMEIIAATLDYDVRFLGSDYNGKDWDGKEQETIRGIPPHFLKRDHKLSSSDLKRRVVCVELNKTNIYMKSCKMCAEKPV